MCLDTSCIPGLSNTAAEFLASICRLAAAESRRKEARKNPYDSFKESVLLVRFLT